MSEGVTPYRPPLTRGIKSFYGMGFFGASARTQVFGFLLLFYNQLVGLDARLVSLAIAIALLIDAFWDPIVGQISDNTHSRWGRRHPYIYGAALPAAICFTLLFMPPHGWSQLGLFLWLLVFVVGVRMLDSLNEIPGGALGPELTQDYEERTSVQSYRFLYGVMAGQLAAFVLGYGVFLRSTKAEPFGQLNMAGYAPYAAAIAAFTCVGVIVQGLATHRFIPYLNRPERRRVPFAAVAREMGVALSNRNFVALAGSGLIFGISIGIAIGLQQYLYTYFWEVPTTPWLLIIRLSAIPAGVLAVFIAPLLARRFDKKRAAVSVAFASIFTNAAPIALRLLGVLPPNGSPTVIGVLIADSVLTSLLATTGFIIITSMLMDVVEDTQVRTGRRSEGLLFAVDSLLRKLSNAFSALLPGLLIAYVHFPIHARPGHVPGAVLTHLALLYLPITLGLNLCSVGMVLLYRIDRHKHQANLERLAGAAGPTGSVDPVAS
jgi:Na+/melibiose symporter-like transporter